MDAHLVWPNALPSWRLGWAIPSPCRLAALPPKRLVVRRSLSSLAEEEQSLRAKCDPLKLNYVPANKATMYAWAVYSSDNKAKRTVAVRQVIVEEFDNE